MRNRNVTIGIFVAVGLALFTLAIFLIGDQHKAFAKHVEFYTEFASVSGLTKGAKVRVAGFDAGEVTSIEVPPSPAFKFRLKLKVVERVHGIIRSDSIVTIATEGVVGDKFLLIHEGTPHAQEATSGTTLPSKEPVDMADLLEKSERLLNGASITMNSVANKLNGTLDAVTTTVNNANDVVVGIKHGKGTVGMLLSDESMANNVRKSVANIQQATANLNHASKQADAMITDFTSRDLGEKTDQTIATVQNAAQNFDATSRQVRQTLTTALGPDEQGIDAGTNVQQALSNLNQASGNMAEDTEALKHEFFFRGFFRHRGYFSLNGLNPESYRRDKLFANPANARLWLAAAELFEQRTDGTEVLTAAGKVRIDAALAQLGDAVVGNPLVIEGYSGAGAPGAQLAVSRTRTILVRQYLHTRFQLDLQSVGIVPLRNEPPPGVQKTTWDGVSIVLLSPSGNVSNR